MSNSDVLNFIWKTGQLLNANMASTEVLSVLHSAFADYFDISSLKIILSDNLSQNNFSYFGDTSSISEIISKKYSDILKKLSGKNCFILNKKIVDVDENIQLSEKVILTENENTLFIPISKNKNIIGFMELILKPLNNQEHFEDLIKAFFIVSIQLYELIINRNLNKRIVKSADFYKAQKNIAKILESQYDYSFLIPLIGEIWDSFAGDYFVYIFMKDENEQFVLSWPLRYDKSRIDSVLQTLDMKKQVVIEYDGTLVIFPIFFENALKGAVVIDGKNVKILDEDIDYLSRLAVQTATTLDKAGIYAEIEKYATQDALTGLNNRRSLDLRLAQEFAVAKRKNLPLCVMMLDVDYFKAINDTYGHYVGDIILKEFAAIIKDEIREYDFAARYGGEEFFIILPSTLLAEAQIVATRLKERIASKNFDISQFNDKINAISITSSVGLVSLDEDMDLKTLCQKVDGALYEAKRTGRNKVVIA